MNSRLETPYSISLKIAGVASLCEGCVLIEDLPAEIDPSWENLISLYGNQNEFYGLEIGKSDVVKVEAYKKDSEFLDMEFKYEQLLNMGTIKINPKTNNYRDYWLSTQREKVHKGWMHLMSFYGASEWQEIEFNSDTYFRPEDLSINCRQWLIGDHLHLFVESIFYKDIEVLKPGAITDSGTDLISALIHIHSDKLAASDQDISDGFYIEGRSCFSAAARIRAWLEDWRRALLVNDNSADLE